MTTSIQPDFSGQPRPGRRLAALALVFGVIGIVGVPLFGALAWFMGRRELNALAAGRRPQETAGIARTARILGIVGTAMLLIVSCLFVLALIGVIHVD